MIFLVLLIVFILRVEEARRKGKRRRMDCEQLVFSFMKATHNDY
jgi:hypothetical protein